MGRKSLQKMEASRGGGEEEEEDMLRASADEPGLRVEPVGVRRKADVASG